MKSTKRSLFTSVVALLLCFSMLLGTTFAWFTDVVTSGNNKIVAGNLKVDLKLLEEKDGTTEWVSIKNSRKPIFNHKNWEPGYTDVKILRIDNEGTLALQWIAKIVPLDELSILADVIDVYFYSSSTPITHYPNTRKLTELGYEKVGTLREFAESLEQSSSTPLQAGESAYLGIALHLDGDKTGNEYKNLSCGEFDIKILATQYSAESEKDSFDENYDSSAQFPVFKPADVTLSVVTENNVVTKAAYKKTGSASMSVSAGTKTTGTRLELNVSEMASTGSNLQLEENEILRPLDVHVNGVSKDNTVPLVITLDEAMMTGLNIGNYKLYHVEGGVSKLMTAVSGIDELDAHNQFYYDPATGNVSLAMATFSEVAIVADKTSAWEGNFDYTWYDADATELKISNADQLAGFGAIVGGMNGQTQNSFAGKTVKLTSDINLGDKETENNPDIIFYPIGYYNSEGTYERTNTAITSGLRNFEGTFDGNGHTISNFYQNTWEMKGDNNYYDATLQYYRDGMGLFGRVYGGTVKNLTVSNFSSDGEYTTTGTIAAYADGAAFENIAIFDCNPRVYNIGNGGIVGCVGWYAKEAELKTTFTNITVDNSNKISALWGSYDVACGGIVGQYYPTSGQSSANYPVNAGIHFENCHISAQMDVYNDVCANYQYYAYRYTGMLIGSVRENVTIDGKSYPKMDKITASGCTVHFGTWNDYYYCEIIDNTTASYTHDYQMSRLTEIKAIDGTTITYLDGTTGTVPASGRANYVVVNGEHASENATCYHFKNGEVWTHDMGGIQTGIDENGDGQDDLKEDKQHIYLEFNNLVTGYGWGVTTKGVDDVDGVKILDKYNNGESSEKFVTKFTGDFLYRVGNLNTVSLGSLFDEIDGEKLPVVDSGVWVTVEAVDENMTVGGTFTKTTTSNWEDGKIQFSGTGVVKITIQDYVFCEPTVLYLEVVDAYNATSAQSTVVKDANGNITFANNVVLLNDIYSGFTVSGGYTFYGNGFTLNYTGDGRYLNNGLKQGVVMVQDGSTLDNLHIKAPIYPTAFMYYGTTQLGDYVQQSSNPREVEGEKTRYYYQLSAVATYGSATISNCYIYGGRTNIYVNTGNVTIKDSILECGVVANVQIQSTNEYTVTLENLTTIQYRVNATIGDTSKVMLGAGVLVGPETTSNPKIILNGNFKQYNWVNEDDKNAVSGTMAQMIIGGALDATAYNHTVNGKTASNLGIIYMNTSDANVTNNTGLPYKLGDVEMKVSSSTVNGKVYSLQNATESQIYSDYENADRTTVNGDYMPRFDFDLGNQEISYDGSEDTRYLYSDANGVTALYQDGDTALTLDLTKLATIYKYDGINYTVTAVCKDSNGNDLTATNGVVTLSAQGSYTLVFTVNDNIFYNKNGETITKSVTRTYTVPLTLTVKAAAIKNATVTISKTALDGVYTTVNINDYKLRINFLDAISVTDYDNKGNGTTVSLSNNIASATLTPASVNVFTTAYTITVTYTDGRVLTVNFSKISGSSPGTKTAVVNTSGGLYFITEGALNNKPTESSSQNQCTITSVSFKGNSGSTVTNDTDVTVTWALGSSGGSSPCVTPDTLVTLADGTQKRIDEVTSTDILKVWNFYEGTYDYVPSAIIFDHGYDNNTVIKLTFSDGTVVKVVNLHQFYDVDLKKFVSIDENTVADYVGDGFAKDNGDGTSVVTLVDYEITYEYIEAFGIISALHYNILVEGMISTDFMLEDYDLFNYFEMGDNVQFDKEKMQADIEKYGLYTYEDFDEYLTYEQFVAFNVQYFKIAVGKGNYTYEGIINLIDTYLNN